MKKFFNSENKISFGLVAVLSLSSLFFSGCSKDSSSDETGIAADGSVRLIWFYTDATGDPASAANPHLVKQAIATDGVHFTDAKTIFSANDLVDPDFFALPDKSGFGLIYSANDVLKYAFSSTIDGTYADIGSVGSGGQSATINVAGQLKTFISGVSLFNLTASSSSVSAGSSSSAITVSSLGYSTGVVADPTVITLADGTYRAYVKYAPSGGTPMTHEVWTLKSSDLSTWTNPLLVRTKASVPGAVRVGSQVLLYFVDFSGELNSKGSLAMGLSSDGGETFEYSDVYLDGSEITGAYDPAALAVE